MMEELEVTFKRAAMVWWANLWRSLLLVLISATIVGFLIGIMFATIMQINHVLPEDQMASFPILRMISGAAGVFVSIYVQIRVTKYIIGKKDFNGFRIALVSNDINRTTTHNINK